MLSLVFFVPVLCWLLTASGRAARIGPALALTAIACVQIAVIEGWILRDKAGTVTTALATVVAIFLVVGWILCAPPRSLRTTIGTVLISLWCVLTFLAVLLMVVLFGLIGTSAGVPPDDILLPLPSGLVMSSDTVEKCDGGSTTYCSRTFEIGGSPAVPDAEVLNRVLEYLHRARGWSLQYDETNEAWTDCHTSGWWLDRHNVCVRVFGPWSGVAHGNRTPWRDGPTVGQPPATVSFECWSKN